ncbi:MULTISPECIES: tetratricopeptide repeat protein, partial [Spirulina sp. CCY15215]|uniref:tetratricopeptide repeat protein n=1 Tax=Spirulina sp. CCY15215 TaxID=2767591 RepID=UPI00194FF5AE
MKFWQKWLQQLAEYLQNSTQTDATREDYFRFLREVLQAVDESNSDPQVVYPLLAQHQEKLDPIFAEIIKQWFESELDPNNSEGNQLLARTLVNFANCISQFPLGSRANNIEIAIACYQAALQVLTRDAFPQDWATTQNGLGAAYRNRIRGERGENLEQAIACYQAALQVYTREAFPQDWAITQNNLGTAYSDRIRGERGENLELAIACYQAALQVRTREAFPQQWATTQNNLGEAYRNRIRG